MHLARRMPLTLAVYFAAGDALTHGRLPYRDFVLLHPPAMMLVLSPFGWLTRVVTDQTAFMVANLAVALIGATCAVLVMQIARHLGLGRMPALVGGLFYATWLGAVGAEYHAKLEPVGNLFLLSAVLVAITAQRRRSPWLSVAAGALLGVCLTVKVWWIVPVVGVLLWHGVVTRSVAAAARMTAGAVGAAVLVCLPFFVMAPHQMWDSVIVDQLGRVRMRNLGSRVGDLSTLSHLGHLPSGLLIVGTVIAALLLLAAVASAWRIHSARPAVVLLGVQLVVLLAAPSFFPSYADYLAGALSITFAAAAGSAALTTSRSRRLLRRTAGWLPATAVAAITLVVLATGSAAAQPLPGAAALSRAVLGTRCVMSDSPMGLIEVNALSRDFAQGCQDWVDVTGRTYGPDRSASLSRSQNLRWQADLTRYLRSGNAVMIVRGAGTGISPATHAALSRDGVLAHANRQTIYRVTHSGPGQHPPPAPRRHQPGKPARP